VLLGKGMSFQTVVRGGKDGGRRIAVMGGVCDIDLQNIVAPGAACAYLRYTISEFHSQYDWLLQY